MAGSGRGRGHASFAFYVEPIGFGKGAALPDVICRSPPPFPLSTASILEHSLCSGKLCSHSCLESIMKYMNTSKNFGFYNNVQKQKRQKTLSLKVIWMSLKRLKHWKRRMGIKKNLKMRKTKDKEGEQDEGAEEPEEYDEEEHEEENDYISSYFEDGDGFGVVSDDNMVEAT
ncbi:unnamed protein product [Coccothraustes coccothraustes]